MTKSTKEKILDTAEELFAELGIEGASLRAITGKAGVNLGSIHYYFGSKKNLLKELLEMRVEEFHRMRIEEMQSFLESDSEDLKEMWLIVSRGILNTTTLNPNLLKIISQLMWGPDPEYREILDELGGGFEDAFVAEMLKRFPDKHHKAAEMRCRLMIGMIAISCVDALKTDHSMGWFAIRVGYKELADEMADIAVHALKKFQTD